jgi:hypothetical protein
VLAMVSSPSRPFSSIVLTAEITSLIRSVFSSLGSEICRALILPICQIGNTISTMKTISLKLPAPLAKWLAKRANELGRSRSDLVRQALEEQRQRKNSKSEKSCAALMAEFSSFFQGPRDLSTNPKYMRDFGK